MLVQGAPPLLLRRAPLLAEAPLLLLPLRAPGRALLGELVLGSLHVVALGGEARLHGEQIRLQAAQSHARGLQGGAGSVSIIADADTNPPRQHGVHDTHLQLSLPPLDVRSSSLSLCSGGEEREAKHT